MNRKQFVESQGATCKNWNWSWSFINKSKRFIIFGAWDRFTNGRQALIFSEGWKVNPKGQKSKGFSQSREHIRLIEEAGYRLMTFPMEPDEKTWKDGVVAKIKKFIPKLTEKSLTRIGKDWYAADSSSTVLLAEEIATPEKYPEGAQCTITINAYERNLKARAACLAHYGHICAVCNFNFVTVYGDIGTDFIHVHHLKPIGKIGKEYEVDPKVDLIPVCPNCHAMIHRIEPPLTVKQLRKRIQDTKKEQSIEVCDA